VTDLTGYSILIVDDVAFSRDTVSRLLNTMGTPRLYTAEDGEEALQILESQPDISFVISDFNMPRMNGLEFLKAVRVGRGSVDRTLPFAMLTGYSDRHLVEMALALDVNAFLIKPVSKATLSKRLDNMIGVPDDGSWIKGVAAYKNTQIVGDDSMAEPPPITPEAQPSEGAPSLGGRGAAVLGRGRPVWARDGDAPGAANPSSLSGRFADQDLARDVAASVDRLVAQSGEETASRVVAVLDGLRETGTFTDDDLADVFRPTDADSASGTPPERISPVDSPVRSPVEGTVFCALDQVSEGAVLARELRTTDGSLFLALDTELTGQVLDILHHLDENGVLKLDTGAGGAAGVFVRASDSAPTPVRGGPERRVVPDEIPDGSNLARDLFLSDGRLYLPVGSELTPRIIAIIRDLHELGNIDQDIHIAGPKPG